MSRKEVTTERSGALESARAAAKSDEEKLNLEVECALHCQGAGARRRGCGEGVQLSQNNNAGILHTLGCVYAEIGKTKEAREVLVQAMHQLNLKEPDPNYWYAFGRLAEQYGENEVAAADYNRVKKPGNPALLAGSSYRLAQNRLAAMRAGEARASR